MGCKICAKYYLILEHQSLRQTRVGTFSTSKAGRDILLKINYLTLNILNARIISFTGWFIFHYCIRKLDTYKTIFFFKIPLSLFVAPVHESRHFLATADHITDLIGILSMSMIRTRIHKPTYSFPCFKACQI